MSGAALALLLSVMTTNADYVCKASEAGASYSKLIEKFGEPFLRAFTRLAC